MQGTNKDGDSTSDGLTAWSMDSMDEALLITDELGVVRRVNDAFRRLFGNGEADIVGRARRDLLVSFSRLFRDPAILEKDLLRLYDHPAEEERATWELAEGHGIVRWYSRPVRDAAGRIVGRLESWRKVDENEASLCGIEKESYDVLPVGVIVVRDGMEVVWQNRAGAEILSDVFGLDTRELNNLDAIGHDGPLVGPVIDALCNGLTVARNGVEISDRYFDLVVTPLSAGGKVYGAVVAMTDASAHQQALARYDRFRREAEFYVDLLSHDIRNFNQVSMGYLELLQIKENLTDDERTYLEKALHGVLGSNKLIDDIKRVRMIRESGGKDLAPTDLGKVLAEDVKKVIDSHRGQQVVINYSARPGEMALLNSLVHDVFRHIIENAIKYDTHTAKVIDVDVSESKCDGKDCWTVHFADRGPGIPDARKQSIFERMSGGSTRGAGIGLSIVRLIVDKLGGHIWVEDRVPGDPSQGSVFVVQLPKA
ncbi:MAG TPA: ATP-binding protein [Methanocella sp.]|jgi:signal transduction histidine kinase